tara:strand:- start:1162 stop:2433 length:1272 start_codon:yes stop_codon:yes gene_type:complete
MERMAQYGTLYKNATATAGSTMMTHSSEWTGKYTADLHGGVPFKEREYLNFLPEQDSVFHDFIEMGYDVHIVLVENKAKKTTKTNGKITAFAPGFDSFRPAWNLWPKEANIVKLPGMDIGGEGIRRKDQIMKIAELVEESEKNGKPAFVFLKCHGYNKTEYRTEYLRYAGQQRVTDDDLYNCEIDEALGTLLDHFGYPGNKEAPTIWFASDHGSWAGEGFRNHYGYHLHQEIVHVPLISSKGGGRVVDSVFSMKEVRRLLTGDSPKMNERYIFAETLYPGQITDKPDNGVLSTAKIMVRLNRYKYIYSMHGVEGDGEPEEELYDLAYDPREKFNLAAAFNHTHKDVARPSEGGVPFHHVSSRINSNTKKAMRPETIPKKKGEVEFVNSLQLSGWQEIYGIFMRMRSEAREYWKNTGRGDYFHF